MQMRRVRVRKTQLSTEIRSEGAQLIPNTSQADGHDLRRCSSRLPEGKNHLSASASNQVL